MKCTPITDVMVQLVSNIVSDPVYGSVEFPNQVLSSGLDAKAWIMITIIILFVFLWILGIVVEFTSFGDKSRFTEEERQQLKVEDRKSKLGLAFYSFSPINNVKKLFTVSKRGDQSLAVLNGVRVLSIGWVVVGHSFNFILLVPTVNFANLSLLFEGTLFGIIPAGVFAVDTFFFLSGLLTCYLLAIKMYPKKGVTNFFLVYFHRYYRLIFPLLFMQGFAVWLIRYLGDGPIYRQTWDASLKPCNKYWWSNLLFINNLVPWKMGEEWIGWVWYLANDFQFFLVTPPILYVFCKNRKVGYALFYLLLLGSMLYNGILFGVYNISIIESSKEIDVPSLIYVKPWARIGAYIIGWLFGLGIFELKMKEKHPELKNTLSNLFFR